LVELDAKDPITMPWLSSTSSLEVSDQRSGLLIIDPDNAIRSCCRELGSIFVIINSEQLVQFIINGMEQLATGGVPVLESSIRIYSDDYVFGDGVAGSWSPSQLSGGHWLLHLGI